MARQLQTHIEKGDLAVDSAVEHPVCRRQTMRVATVLRGERTESQSLFSSDSCAEIFADPCSCNRDIALDGTPAHISLIQDSIESCVLSNSFSNIYEKSFSLTRELSPFSWKSSPRPSFCLFPRLAMPTERAV
jgi:hypothetical protein